MNDFYYSPEAFGLETVGQIQWGEPCYDFDLTVVWKRKSDGALVYGEDSGCSCPSPFESQGVDDLTVLRRNGGLSDFQKHCEGRNAEKLQYGYTDQMDDIAALVERMYAAGAR